MRVASAPLTCSSKLRAETGTAMRKSQEDSRSRSHGRKPVTAGIEFFYRTEVPRSPAALSNDEPPASVTPKMANWASKTPRRSEFSTFGGGFRKEFPALPP